MSSCAILCPGPSLPLLWKPPISAWFDTIFAVNTAGHRYACHWLAFADIHIVQPIRDGRVQVPLKGYICKRGHFDTFAPNIDLSQGFKQLGKRPQSMENDLDPKCGYTFANTLAWAQWFKYDPITVFGFDCAQVPTDFTGQPGDHAAGRWLKELPWIKAAWGPNVRVVSDIDPAIEAWLNDPASPDSDLLHLLGLDKPAVSA